MRPLLLALTLLAVAAPATAQRDSAPRRVAEWSAERDNDRLLGRAFERAGVDADRRALAAARRAFDDLWPGERYARYRLTRVQARVLVRVVLDDLLDDRPGYDRPGYDRPGYGRPGGDRPGGGFDLRRDLADALYDLAERVPANAFSLFLTPREKADARAGAQQVGRLATSLGCTRLADLALQLRADAEPGNASREEAVETIAAMRRAAEACR